MSIPEVGKHPAGSMSRKGFLEILVVLVLFSLVSIASHTFQKRISYNAGQGWDGEQYYATAEQFAHGKLPVAAAPFVYRVGTPFLVSLFGAGNILAGFLAVNMIANAIAVVLLLLLLRKYIGGYTLRILMVLLFITQWHGPVRFVHWYPAYVDPFLFVFIVAGLLIIHRVKAAPSRANIAVLGILIFCGVLFREMTLLIAFIVPFVGNPLAKNNTSWPAIREKLRTIGILPFLPLLCGIVGLVTAHLIASSNNSYSFLVSAYSWSYNKPLLCYVHSWFIAFGPIIAISLFDFRNCWSFLKQEQPLLVFLCSCTLLAWIGGSDTERILYWSMPVVYILLARSIQNTTPLLKSRFLILTLIVAQGISQRVFLPIPDYPNEFQNMVPILTPIGSDFPALDLFAFHGRRIVEAVSLLQYSLCVGFFIWWLYRRYRKIGVPAHETH